MVFLIDPGDLKGPKPCKDDCYILCTTYCKGVVTPCYGIPPYEEI